MFFDTELIFRVKLLPSVNSGNVSISYENNNSVSLHQINIQVKKNYRYRKRRFKYTFKCLTLNGNTITGPDE